jgi:hypothetical protein
MSKSGVIGYSVDRQGRVAQKSIHFAKTDSKDLSFRPAPD